MASERSTLGSAMKAKLRESVEADTPIARPVRPLAPTLDRVTQYDVMHMLTYVILVDESGDGLELDEYQKRWHGQSPPPWEWMARKYLGRDPEIDPEKAKACYDSHLARAKWFHAEGMRLYLEHGAVEDKAE